MENAFKVFRCFQISCDISILSSEFPPFCSLRSFWELDPTEGYLRQRNRLRKTKLNLASRFFQPNVAKCLGKPATRV